MYAITVQQMSGINLINTASFYKVSELQYYSIFSSILPEFFQLLGTVILLIVNWSTKLKNCFWKSNRKPLIKLGCISSCVVMMIALIL